MKINKRHIAKSLTWRSIGTIDTFIVTWLITGDMIEGMNLSIITIFTKLIWYYFHEHFWFKSSLKNTNKRHVFKTFTWRVIGTLDTILFGWLMTGNPLTGLKIGGIETASKMLLYFGHEKFWYKINYGLDTQNRPRQLKNLQTKIKVRK